MIMYFIMSRLEEFAQAIEQNTGISVEMRTGQLDILSIPQLAITYQFIKSHYNIDPTRYNEIISNNQGLGLSITSLTGKEVSVVLNPISDIGDVLSQRNKESILEHMGWISVGDYDNYEQMRTLGIYGNPSNQPTYLRTSGSEVVPTNFGSLRRLKESIFIQVEPSTLQRLRDIYIDPETLIALGSDVFGESFFVLGGIPADAIKAVAVFKGQSLRRIH